MNKKAEMVDVVVRIVRPDDVKPGMDTAPVPEWLSPRECGIGSSDGVMWIIDRT